MCEKGIGYYKKDNKGNRIRKFLKLKNVNRKKILKEGLDFNIILRRYFKSRREIEGEKYKKISVGISLEVLYRMSRNFRKNRKLKGGNEYGM